MFSIERKLVKIKKVTPIEEFKGDKRDYGCSVRIEWIADNTVLDHFDKDARTAFYERDTGKTVVQDDGQQEISMPRADVELTKRKCVSVEMPLHFRKELPGYTFIFYRGATEASEIKLIEVMLDNFDGVLHDGGSVLMSCNAYMKPQVEQRGYIDHMSKTEIEISLTPPETKQEDLLSRQSKKKSGDKADRSDPFAGSDLENQQPETA